MEQHKQHKPLALSVCWNWSSTLVMMPGNPGKTSIVPLGCKCLGMYTSCWAGGCVLRQ